MKKILFFVFSLIIFSGIFGGNYNNKIQSAGFGEQIVTSKITSTSVSVVFTQSNVGIRTPYNLLLVDLDNSLGIDYNKNKVLQSNDISYTDHYEATVKFDNLKPESNYKINLLANDNSFIDEISFKTLPAYFTEKIAKITSFSPLEGKVGDEITITGTNLEGFKDVSFGSIVSSAYWVSDTQIKAKVPVGALTNKITVKTTNGDAVSAGIFKVLPSIPPTFICNKEKQSVRSDDIFVSVEVNNGNANDYQIGILKTGNDNKAQANFNSFLYVDGKEFTANYKLNLLERGVTYKVLIFKKSGEYVVDAPNCNFTVPVVINGVCGSATGKTFSSTPTSGLCNPGTPSKVEKNYKQWQWTCTGANYGTNSQTCIANVGDSTVTTTTEPVVDASSEGGGLVPDCPADGCGFEQLMELINNVIKFLLFTIATPLAALIFVYAGFMLLTSGGSSEKMTTAKKILTNLIIGYVIALAAWLVINTILTSEFLGYDGPTFLQDN